MTKSEGLAGRPVSLFWGSLTAGRFLLGAIAGRVGVRRLLILCITAGLSLLPFLSIGPL